MKIFDIIFHFIKEQWKPLLSIGWRMAGLLLGFILTYFIAHFLGAEDSGHYAMITQTAILGSVIAAGGLDLSVIRNFSSTQNSGTHPSRKSVNALLLLCSTASIVVFIALCAVGLKNVGIAYALHAPTLSIVCLSTLILSRALLPTAGAVLRSQRYYSLSPILEAVVIPALVCLCIAVGWARDLNTILICTAVAAFIAALAAVAACQLIARSGAETLSVGSKQLIKTAAPLWGVAISRCFGDWYALAIVAALLSVHDVGVLRVATQIGIGLVIISVGILNVYAPRISAAYAMEDFASIAKLNRSSALLSTLIVLPVTLCVLALAGEIMQFFGDDFAEGAPLLQMIVIGQAAFVCTGASGVTLAMTGNERVNLALTIGSMAALLILVPVAAHYGSINWVGATLSLVLIGRNLASMAAVRKRLGISMLTGRYYPLDRHILD